MIQVDPQLRFDNTSFSNVWDERGADPTYSRYKCPDCGEAVAFTKDKFLNARARERFSNLPPAISAKFDDWASSHGLSTEPFLDWVCPGCRLAIRTYVKDWAGGRHGDCGANIVAVLEDASGAESAL